MRIALVLACLVLLACEGPPTVARVDSGPREDAGVPQIDAGDNGPTTIPGGALTEDLCGVVTVEGAVEVPVGSTVTVCAGTTMTFAGDAGLTVDGTLVLAGEEALPIRLEGDPRWPGVVVSGTLEADFTQIHDAQTALTGQAGSTIRFDDGLVDARATQNARLANGGTFDRTRILGGGTLRVSGGTLRMTDSTIDLDNPGTSPDCTAIANAGMVLDHVLITNCHCPLHINSISGELTVTNSVFDGAAYPVMIRQASGRFTGNVFDGTAAQLQDIGGSIDVDLAGNWYEGDAPILDTDDESQFRNVSDALTTRPADAGPR